jgi:hypothetical protein
MFADHGGEGGNADFGAFLQDPFEAFGAHQADQQMQLQARFGGAGMLLADAGDEALFLDGFEGGEILVAKAIEQGDLLANIQAQYAADLADEIGIFEYCLLACNGAGQYKKAVGVAISGITFQGGSRLLTRRCEGFLLGSYPLNLSHDKTLIATQRREDAKNKPFLPNADALFMLQLVYYADGQVQPNRLPGGVRVVRGRRQHRQGQLRLRDRR